MTDAKPQVACVACSVLQSELESLQERGEIDFPIQFLDSMLHMRPIELRSRLGEVLDRSRPEGAITLLVYGDCHNHMSQQESAPGVQRVAGCNCIEMILGAERYRTLCGAGAFFLLPEWTLRWREVFEQELGLSDKMVRDFMRESHTKLIYLDTGQIPVPRAHLEEASQVLGLPYEVLPVGLEHLLDSIRQTLRKQEDS